MLDFNVLMILWIFGFFIWLFLMFLGLCEGRLIMVRCKLYLVFLIFFVVYIGCDSVFVIMFVLLGVYLIFRLYFWRLSVYWVRWLFGDFKFMSYLSGWWLDLIVILVLLIYFLNFDIVYIIVSVFFFVVL